MEYAIILDTDINFARHLRQMLSQLRQVKVTVMPTPEDVRVAIMRQPQDWAFIPLEDAVDTAVLLQAVQPDIRIIVVSPEPGAVVSDDCAELVHGLLSKTQMVEELEAVLATAVAGTPLKSLVSQPDTAVIIAALQQIELDRVISSVVMGQGSNYLAHWGDFSNTQAHHIASFVGTEWMQVKSRTRLQFFYMEERATEVMLYTRHVVDDYFVTLVALPEAPLVEMRRQADRLVFSLNTVLHGGQLSPNGDLADNYEEDGHNSFALVWRPLRPLPPQLQPPLAKALERLAEANACILTHVDVRAEYIHIVVTCPPGRDSTWAATLFKNGSEAAIQQKFNVSTAVWGKGFYATDSIRPLSAAELNLFLTN